MATVIDPKINEPITHPLNGEKAMEHVLGYYLEGDREKAKAINSVCVLKDRSWAVVFSSILQVQPGQSFNVKCEEEKGVELFFDTGNVDFNPPLEARQEQVRKSPWFFKVVTVHGLPVTAKKDLVQLLAIPHFNGYEAIDCERETVINMDLSGYRVMGNNSYLCTVVGVKDLYLYCKRKGHIMKNCDSYKKYTLYRRVNYPHQK